MADIVIVDDDVDTTNVLSDILRGEGHVVRSAHNGHAGLEMVTRRRPDLLLLDVEMPILGGPEMAGMMIARDSGLESTPIVLLSGVLDVASAATRIGTPYYLAKPYTLDAILRLTDRALREGQSPNPQWK